MKDTRLDLTIPCLGHCRIPSPMDAAHFVGDEDHKLYHSTLPEIEAFLEQGKQPLHYSN